jgi:hypothetical protein
MSLDFSAGMISCAWEAGFEYGIIVVPVVFSKQEWEEGPERFSLLSQVVHAEGIYWSYPGQRDN